MPSQLVLDGLSATVDFIGMQNSLAAKVIVKLLMVSHIVAMGEIEISHSAERLDLFDERRGKPGRVDEDIALRSLNQVACSAKRFLGVVAAVIYPIGDWCWQAGLYLTDILRRFDSADGRGRAGEQRLQPRLPFGFGLGLMVNGR